MGSVYFIRCGEARGPIKIGRAIRVAKRLENLQIGSYEPLTLLLAVDCDRTVELGLSSKLEAKLHREFADLHIRGEWYRWHPDLDAAIDLLRDPPRFEFGVSDVLVIDVDAIVFPRSEDRR